MDKAMILKENIKKYRLAGKQSGLKYCKSAKTFAEHIGLNPKTYTNYEQQSRKDVPDYDSLVIIAQALCVSIDKLLDYVPSENLQEIETRNFLQSLSIPYRIEFNNDKKIYILSYPDKSRQDISIEYIDLKEMIESYKSLNFAGKSLFIRQFIFLGMAKDIDDFSIDNLEVAEHRLELIEFAKKMRLAAKDKDYFYGLSNFRGGK